jgi:hypothetical protein
MRRLMNRIRREQADPERWLSGAAKDKSGLVQIRQ